MEKLLNAADLRGQTMIWLGIGLGFGAKDLSVVRVGQIAEENYDLRRAKTGIERYGETPPLVWDYVQSYVKQTGTAEGELLFRTRNGEPMVHGNTNAVSLWWGALRRSIGESPKTLDGFYVLRHLGATEYGSRPGASISAVNRWLGHASSSSVADVYMKPVAPEYRNVVQWAREKLS